MESSHGIWANANVKNGVAVSSPFLLDSDLFAALDVGGNEHYFCRFGASKARETLQLGNCGLAGCAPSSSELEYDSNPQVITEMISCLGVGFHKAYVGGARIPLVKSCPSPQESGLKYLHG
ncbi:MAG: hypothetical protein U1G07_22315 [Verrucomicrobiota bacterium]